MGRDIYTFIERRKGNSKWECIATDHDIMAYRDPTLFAILSYNMYEGNIGVSQKKLKDWVATLSAPTRNYLFIRVDGLVTEIEPLFGKDQFDYNDFVESLEIERVTVAESREWISSKLSFLLTGDIVSNPDACYWNWCSADELAWALCRLERQEKIKLDDNDDYREILSLMRENEDLGYEVRLVYSYDNSTEWVGCMNEAEPTSELTEFREESSQSSEYTDNKLMLYILQCRSTDFISHFEAQNNRCFMGVYSLYLIAWANYKILSIDSWTPSFMEVVKPCRVGCEEIIHYLRTVVAIPNTLDNLKRHLKSFANYDDFDALYLMLDGELSQLTDLGYREIDCRLYEAGMKLDYDEAEKLLAMGANPNIFISSSLSPSEAEDNESETYCLSREVNSIVFDTVDIDNIDRYWIAGVKNEPQKVRLRDIEALFKGAAYRLMEELLSKRIPQ